jgi:hypothetical protein
VLRTFTPIAVVICLSALPLAANERVTAAVRTAFASLLALPADTQAEKMGTWVLDTDGTALNPDPGEPWTILVTQLTDTGQELKLAEQLVRLGATSTPRQMADGAKAMQQLEGRIAKAEADTMLHVVARIDPPEVALQLISDDVDVEAVSVDGATHAVRVKGRWITARDRELDVDYERWSTAALLVTFGPFDNPTKTKAPATGATRLVAKSRAVGNTPVRTVTIQAEGSEEMIAKLIAETRWSALASLIK